jgi:hypothetical protein
MSDLQQIVLSVLTDPPPKVLMRLDPRGDRTQGELADILGVSQATISEWYSGKQSMSRRSRYLALGQLGFRCVGYNQWEKLS